MPPAASCSSVRPGVGDDATLVEDAPGPQGTPGVIPQLTENFPDHTRAFTGVPLRRTDALHVASMPLGHGCDAHHRYRGG